MKLGFRWPRTLASQLSLIFLVNLVCAHRLSFSAQFYERYISARTAMLGNLESDVCTSVSPPQNQCTQKRNTAPPQW